MKKFQLLFLLLLSISSVQATHNLGGYISVKPINGLEYEITVTIVADAGSPAIERREIVINYGDNSGLDSITETSRTTIRNTGFQLIERKFVTRHTYPAVNFDYTISIEDPNRNVNIVNITNSVNVPFFLSTTFSTSLFQVPNHSPTLAPNLSATTSVGRELNYNFAAYDKDGDFLTYRLVPTKAFNGNTAPGYGFPSGAKIDLINGELRWNPQSTGIYAFTVEIAECRDGNFIGKTNVDLQVVVGIPDMSAPIEFVATFLNDTNQLGNIYFPILPGDTVELTIQEANGYDVCLLNNEYQAQFDTISGSFQWISDSSDLRCSPHLFVFEASRPFSNNERKHLSIMVEVRDSTVNCDTLCGYNIISVPEFSQQTLESKVIPNPFQESTTIYIEGKFGSNYKLRLFNTTGQLIREEIRFSNEFTVERDDLPEGVYFFTIDDERGAFGSGKLVIQ